jgi:hypothetical protein
MAQIKLGAMVSDIKGKQQGTVFAGGPGGLYMRNQTSGGGKKSQRWDLQKAKLASLASQWRGLTAGQQQAWSDAAPLYPTTNKFGDPRIPSGYELFMSLNGNIMSAGLPMMNTPVAPRATPEPANLKVFVPGYVIILPNRVAAFHTDEGNPAVPSSAGFFDETDLSVPNSFSSRYLISSDSTAVIEYEKIICLQYIELSNAVLIGLFIVYHADGSSTLTTRFYYPGVIEGAYVMCSTYEVPAAQTSTDFHIRLSCLFLDGATYRLWLDGVLLTEPVEEVSSQGGEFWLYPFTDDSTVAGDFQDMTAVTGLFSLGDSTFTVDNIFDVSNFSYFENDFTAGLASQNEIVVFPTGYKSESINGDYHVLVPDMDYNAEFIGPTNALVATLLKQGFILETETAFISFSQDFEGVFFNEEQTRPQYDMLKIGGPATNPIYADFECFHCTDSPGDEDPVYHFPTHPGDDLYPENFALQLSGASSISTGISDYKGKVRRFATIPLNNKYSFLSGIYQSICSIAAFNSNYVIQASLIDLETGQRLKTPWPVQFIQQKLEGDQTPNIKAAERFKAGSELSGKVN